MSKKSALITGANGEMGHALIQTLSESGLWDLVALDINPLDSHLRPKVKAFYQADILDQKVLSELQSLFCFDSIFHLAALLSTGSEKNPVRAHNLNVDGTIGLLSLAREHTLARKESVKFLFPSTIAVYGMENLNEKKKHQRITEDQFLSPITMYGVNKLYVENLGRYFAKNFNLLNGANEPKIDFRAIRFPGILSADTVPTSGTSDYGPEMLHYAAQSKAYSCFVRPDSKIPFMTMPDAVRALLELHSASQASLTSISYNISGFSVSAEEIKAEVLKYFPEASIDFKVDQRRQGIVDSWPEDCDDSKAQRDWGWKPEYNLARAFAEYLVPGVCQRYDLLDSKKKCANS